MLCVTAVDLIITVIRKLSTGKFTPGKSQPIKIKPHWNKNKIKQETKPFPNN